MGLNYYHLRDSDVRAEMVSAWEDEDAQLAATDAHRQCYGGQRLTAGGLDAFRRAMPRALAVENDDWLLAEMDNGAYWNPRERRTSRRGKVFYAQYNQRQALEVLCFGEFNTAYIRGLARALVARGETECIVYRAGAAMERRSECTAWEEQVFPLQQVLDGHRARYYPPPGNPMTWSVPSGPNCHHSIRACQLPGPEDLSPDV